MPIDLSSLSLSSPEPITVSPPIAPLVVLLKSPEEDVPETEDPYAIACASRGLDSHFIPVLQSDGVNGDELIEVLRRGPQGVYGGVIVTSSRAAGMWVRAARELEVEDSSTTEVNGADWTSTPFYVVGQKTGRALFPQDPTTPAPHSKHRPSRELVLGADESGTGSKLAEFILSDYPSRVLPNRTSSAPNSSTTTGSLPPLLYLTGDKTTGALEAVIVKDGRIPLKTLQVYKTWSREADQFEEDFDNLRRRIKDRASSPAHSQEEAPSPSHHQIIWLVFFAPSAARAVLPTARKYFSFRPELPPPPQPPSSPPHAEATHYDTGETLFPVHVAAIGPTTAEYLRTDPSAQIRVDVVPEKPSAEDVARTISEFCSRLDNRGDV